MWSLSLAMAEFYLWTVQTLDHQLIHIQKAPSNRGQEQGHQRDPISVAWAANSTPAGASLRARHCAVGSPPIVGPSFRCAKAWPSSTPPSAPPGLWILARFVGAG